MTEWLLLRDVRLTGPDVPAGADSVLIQGERIAYAGAWAESPEPLRQAAAGPGATVLSLPGSAVTPGLINCHDHVTFYRNRIVPMAAHFAQPPEQQVAHGIATLEAALAAGITTVRDAGAREHNFALAAALVGRFDLPDWIHPGTPIAAAGTYGSSLSVEVRSRAEAERAAAEQLERGAGFLKLFVSNDLARGPGDGGSTFFDLDTLRALVRLAERRGAYVAAHACGWAGVEACLRSGVRSIEHGLGLTPSQAREMVQAGAFLVPTASGFYEYGWNGEGQWGRPPETTPLFREMYPLVQAAVTTAAEQGVAIACGTDSLGAMAQELEILHGCGLAIEQALAAATGTAARLLRVEHDRGRIAPGLLADLAVWYGDPSADLSLLCTPPHLVIRRGRVAAAAGDRTGF